jgi:hypothetical protein
MALPGITFEIVRSSGPVLGLRADRTAMLALTERGPEEVPTLVHSHQEFVEIFGGEVDGMLGPLAARAYFENGGEELIVARVVPKHFPNDDGVPVLATKAVGTLGVVGASDPSFLIELSARDRGAFANRLSVEAELTVRKRFRGTIVNPTTIEFPGLNAPLFDASDLDMPARALGREASGENTEAWGLIDTVSALGSVPGTQTIAITEPVFTGAVGLAVLEVYEPTFALRIHEPTRPDIVVSGLDLRDLDATREALASSGVTITTGTDSPDAELPLPGIVVRLSGGSDGLDEPGDPDELAAAQQALRASFLRALEALEPSELPDVVIAPDLWSRIFRTKGIVRLALEPETAIEIADEMVLSAQRTRDRVVLLDPPLGGSNDLRPLGIDELENWRAEREFRLVEARDFAAAYTPWPRIVAGPKYRGDDTLLFPPSAFIAGQMARTARARGPWIATGNVALEQVIGLEQALTAEDEERLQDVGINPIRMTLPRGATIEGVRSIAWPDRKPWRFISTRRLFNFLRRAVRPIGLSYVFEPNSPETWIALRRDIERLLRDMFQRGAFSGARPEFGFFVKVDDQLNPQDARDNGILTVQIGVAPAFPLEFLVVRLIIGRGIVEVTEEPILR